MITNDLLFREQPQCCYIEFPTWQHPHYSPRKPKDWAEWDKFYTPAIPPYRPYENDKRFKETVINLKFRLELAGFAKEDISVTVGENKYLNVNSTNGQKPLNKVFTIPNAENYNLANPTAQMNNGLLEIFFAAKKEEVQTIKIL